MCVSVCRPTHVLVLLTAMYEEQGKGCVAYMCVCAWVAGLLGCVLLRVHFSFPYFVLFF